MLCSCDITKLDCTHSPGGRGEEWRNYGHDQNNEYNQALLHHCIVRQTIETSFGTYTPSGDTVVLQSTEQQLDVTRV